MAEKRKEATHSQADVDRGLLAYYTAGSFRKAEEESGIPRATLSRWVLEMYPARYRELAERLGPEIERGLIERFRRTADLAAQATDDAIHATRSLVEAGEAKDASAMSTVARNLSTVAGINTDKALVLQGKPTSITQHTSAEDALKALAQMVGVTLEGTAEEIHEPPALNNAPESTPRSTAT